LIGNLMRTFLPLMSILGCVATDAEALVAAVASSAGVDWRAAAWLLEHLPQHLLAAVRAYRSQPWA
jgi:hypothetical protein